MGLSVFTKIKYLFLVMLLLSPFPLFSAIQSLSFRSVTISEGLSHNTINTIYKDGRGFVWLGTQTGLDRFDGINITNYPQFKGRTVFSVAEIDSVFLWVGTDNGLMKFNRKTELAEPVNLTDKTLLVKHIFVDKNGKLFVSTSWGLYYYKDGAFCRILFDPNALSATNNVRGVIDGEENTIWVITNDGLVHYNVETDEFEVYKNDIKGGINGYSCLAKMGNTIYLGTASRGMLSFNVKSKSFALYSEVGNGCINALVPAANDTLYIGTNGSGIKIVQATTGKELASIEHKVGEGGLCSNAIYALHKDRNILYIGTYMGGLSYTPTCGNVFSVYAYSSLFNSYNMNVRAFFIDTQGRKVIGTRDGLCYISEQENLVRYYTSESSVLRSNIILFVKPLEEDYLVGTYGGGMYLLNPETGELTFFKQDDCFKENSFTECDEDEDGHFWISGTNGVYRYDKSTGKYVVYNSRNSSLSCKSIFTVKVDSKDRIWFGGSGAVFMYDKATDTFKSDMFPEYILPYTKSIRYIYEDSEKNLWFCDDKEGVVKVDGHFTKFEHITADDFLSNNSVGSIVEDPKDGGLWFATQCGLMYVKDEHHKIFSMYDGIPGYIFNNPVQVTADGLWWGNERGLVHYMFGQKEYEKSLTSLSPAITGVAVAGKKLRTGDELLPYSSVFMDKIILPASDNNIAFTFSALNYAVENTDMYEYYLDGYDEGWKILMKGNLVTYTNLPVGNYVFKVRAASNPGAIKSVNVEVIRRFPFTLWTIVLCIITCLILLYSYHVLLSKYKKIKSGTRRQTGEVEVLPREKYQKSRVEDDEVARIKIKLEACMNKDKMYLNPNLKLQDVANSIGCNAGDLSQVLNLYLRINFTDYINQYRVEEFMLRVQDRSALKYTLASLSEQCGFSSRTSFFRSFKKLKGKSPAEYIKEKGILLE